MEAAEVAAEDDGDLTETATRGKRRGRPPKQNPTKRQAYMRSYMHQYKEKAVYETAIQNKTTSKLPWSHQVVIVLQVLLVWARWGGGGG